MLSKLLNPDVRKGWESKGEKWTSEEVNVDWPQTNGILPLVKAVWCASVTHYRRTRHRWSMQLTRLPRRRGRDCWLHSKQSHFPFKEFACFLQTCLFACSGRPHWTSTEFKQNGRPPSKQKSIAPISGYSTNESCLPFSSEEIVWFLLITSSKPWTERTNIKPRLQYNQCQMSACYWCESRLQIIV